MPIITQLEKSNEISKSIHNFTQYMANYIQNVRKILEFFNAPPSHRMNDLNILTLLFKTYLFLNFNTTIKYR